MDTNPLAEMVTEHCERTGDTLSAIATRGGMSRQTLSGLMHREGPKSFPRDATLEALATGLGMSLAAVRQVAAETAYGEPESPAPRRLVTVLLGHVDGMTDEELEVVLATARAVKRLPRPA